MFNNKLTYLYHFLGSIIFLSIPIVFSPDFSSDLHFIYIRPFQKDLIYHVLLLIFFYLNYLVFIPKFYFNRKYVLYGLCLVTTLIFINIIPELIVKLFNHSSPDLGHEFREHMHREGEGFREGLGHDSGHRRKHGPNEFLFIKNAFQFLFVAIVGLIIQTNRRLKIIEQNRIDTELSYLKSQINPHFLFNTLNSIYSLAIIGSNNTADAVVKLSNMMRYVLNDASREWVSLEQEVNYIKNYIELQKLRFDNSVKINFEVVGELENKMIAPLLFIPFIENAFKYGVNAEQNSDINIEISIKQKFVQLNVRNNIVDYTQTSMDSHGIGIENTKSRLQILYPEKHILVIENKEGVYEINLILHFI